MKKPAELRDDPSAAQAWHLLYMERRGHTERSALQIMCVDDAQLCPRMRGLINAQQPAATHSSHPLAVVDNWPAQRVGPMGERT